MELDGTERVRIAEELKQSYTRFGYIIFLAPVLTYCNIVLKLDITKLNIIYIIYTIITVTYFVFIKRYTQKFIKIRRYIMATIDIIGTTAIINYLGYYGFIFNLLYLWIAIGNLIRFGEKNLIVTIAVTYISLFVMYLSNPFWKQHTDMIIYMIVSITLIPSFVAITLKRLIKENKELSKLLQFVEMKSKIDSLTMIPNRLFFEIEIKKFMSKNIPFALLFIDIDGFKDVNDNYGHDIGDAVLKEIAERLKYTIDNSDFVARLGGDEFVVISFKNKNGVRKLSEKICKTLSLPYGPRKNIKNISASIGISYFPEDTTDEFMLKRYADIAMYAVKYSGKQGFVEYCSCLKDTKPNTLSKQYLVKINHCDD